MNFKARSLASLSLLATVVTAGCLSPRPAINRVQPDYLNKMDFIPNQYAALTAGASPLEVNATMLAKEPVYYTQTTLISKPTTSGFTGLTSYSQADKIRWDVTEHFLVARQAYQFVHGAPTGAAGIGNNIQTGDPVAIFSINSHFDIKHDYNTTTGEELNVLVENSSDRPWYLRQYMHVDWSQNLVTSYNTVLAEAQWEGKVNSVPSAIFVNGPNDPNAPTFEWSGDGKLTYFDIVNKAILHPETSFYSYSDHPGSTTTYTAIPACYLGHEDSIDCAPSEVTFRVAFRRWDRNRDYEPAPVNTPIVNTTLTNSQNFQHLDMERFGFFDQARVGYDTVWHSTLDTQRMHFASRHNLWLYHHLQKFGQDTATGCNTDNDCSGGNVCHIQNKPADASHRGLCAPLAAVHDQSDIQCQTDDDCLQTVNSQGQSATAFCDAGTHTCAEHYYRCGSDADCISLDKNSTCDLASAYNRVDNRGLCLMPFLQRQVRPIAYHESTGYPDYMQPVTETIVGEWNDAFRNAVSTARRHECELNASFDPSGTDANPCDTDAIKGLDPKYGADAQFVYVGCHSPVWGIAQGPGQHSAADVAAANAKGWDLPACGPQGTNARIGDLRYSMIGAITDHDQQGYWGLANIASDPETGEMVVGRGAVWQTITDTYGIYLATLVQLINGNLDVTSITDGDYILESMKQLGTGRTPSSEILDAPLRAENSLATIGATRTGLDALILPNRTYLGPGDYLFSNSSSSDPTKQGKLLQAQNALLGSRLLGDGTPNGTNRLLSLVGTPLEGRLMNSEQVLLAPTGRTDPTGASQQTLDDASPLRRQSLAMRRSIDAVRSNLSAFECQYDAAVFTDDILAGFAKRLAAVDGINPTTDGPLAFGKTWDFKGGTDTKTMAEYAAQFIHHGVLAHELGHSIGQRHNFAASADAVNYFDSYWKVRGQGHPALPTDTIPGLRPRYTYLADPKDGTYLSPEEIDGRVEEYSYSSVMDYKGLNEDAHGIGKYDYAFVKNGYVGMVEAFKNVADAPTATVYAVNTAGTGLSTPLDLRGGGVKGMHYTQIPQIYGTKTLDDGSIVPNIGADNRYDVFLRETCGLGSNTACNVIDGWGPPAFSNATVDGHLLVPYRFDTDERAGLIWQVQRYDEGADAYESLHYVTERVLNYYFANSFARLRSGFSTAGYVNRIWSRYIGQLHQTTQTLAFDLINFQQFFAPDLWKKYLTDPNLFGGFVNLTTMSMSADTVVGLMTMPATGIHANQAQGDKTQLITPITFGNGLVNIPVNQGRAFESSWRQDVGFFWYDELNTAGAYYDKVAAIQALTDPDLLLLQRDTPTDIRLFELSYYTMYPDQMLRLFGGVIAEDYNDYAPIGDLGTVGQDGVTMNRTHVATLNLPPGKGAGQSGRVVDRNHVAVDPQNHFTIQLWAIVHGMAQFPATYDQRYVDYARLWEDGSVEAITVQNPDVNTVWFTDPWAQTTYRALHIGAGPGEGGATVGASPLVHLASGQVANEAGIAARAILHLKDLDAARQAAIVKGEPNAIASSTLEEQQYIDVIHAMRDVTAQFGHGYSATP